MSANTNFARTLRSRTFKTLSQEKVEEVLGCMGEVMSLFKLNRKVAVMATVLYEMEVGQSASAAWIAETANKSMQAQSAINTHNVGGIMKVIEKWGYVARLRRTRHDAYTYRRVK
tara:strand:- start:2042 stop:2386 length:345 start_codon:yes stop_codon:yes gene_type:complete